MERISSLCCMLTQRKSIVFFACCATFFCPKLDIVMWWSRRSRDVSMFRLFPCWAVVCFHRQCILPVVLIVILTSFPQGSAMSRAVFVALLGLSLGLVHALPTQQPDDGKHWVLIVAGSNGWYNYRHQVTTLRNTSFSFTVRIWWSVPPIWSHFLFFFLHPWPQFRAGSVSSRLMHAMPTR